MRQSSNEHSQIYLNLCRGLQLVLWGLVEIIVIGFRAGAVVDGVVIKESPGLLFTLGAIAMFVIELYFYLDGGWSIIRGFAQCFGRELDRNIAKLVDKKWITIIIAILLFANCVLLKFGFGMLEGAIFGGLMPAGVEFSVFNIKKTLLGLGMDKLDYEVFALMMVLVFVVEILHLKGVSIREWIEKRNMVFRWVIYLMGIILVVVFGYYGTQI